MGRTQNVEQTRVRRRRVRRRIPAAFISQLANVQPSYLGRMDDICCKCDAKHWIGERPATYTANNRHWTTCCNKGNVAVDLLREPPPYLKDLYDNAERSGRHFRDHIRRYNAAFAFSSIRCEPVNPGMPNMPFQIHGQMYHIQGPLTNDTPENSRFAQLYIYDTQFATSVRASRHVELNRNIISNITIILHEVYSLVHTYKHAHQVLSAADQGNDDTLSARILPSLRIQLITGSNRRTENLPTSSEVAMIIPDETSSASFRDVRIYLRDSTNEFPYTTISQNHALYMPSHYILLFPRGDLGWTWSLRQRNQKRLTQLMYYRFRLHTRNTEYPIIFKAKRLFQQYLVDIWAICDQNKLDWFRRNQKKIRADLYGGIEDALISEDIDPRAVGRLILPSTYTGGPRFMAKLYQNSMAIVRYFGKPSLFITFTSNPNWKEIQDELFPGQSATDRPDLVSRVFDLKVKELLKDIKQKKIFGSYNGLVRTVEYQKRGLPHLHLLLFLDSSMRIDTVEQIDEVISAEIPSKAADPDLHEIVTRNMVHGPCGTDYPNSPCMVADNNGVLKCSKRFPKAFTEETIVNENGYPNYRRSAHIDHNDRYFIPNPSNRSQQLEIDNRWIVPYNPYLSKKYNAHINVECCHGVASIKYINKYVYKGK